MTTPPDEARQRTIAAAAHPIVIGAGALVLFNDYVLREVSPGWLTGKLSDAGFLVVLPVAIAAVLAGVGASARRARGVGLVGAGGLYVVLQLWPPLGAFFRASHVPDAEDLIVLPALALALAAWRSPRERPVVGALALPFLAGVLVATSWDVGFDASLPCGEGATWDPTEPLYVNLAALEAPMGTDAFVRGLRLTDGDGVDVPLVAATSSQSLAVVCARDGLRGDTAYTWQIGPWTEEASNEVAFVHRALPTVRFRTLPGDGPPARDPAACAALARRTHVPSDCDDGTDTGPLDTGDTSDTGPLDTGETGDTGPADTADTGETGDTGPTDTADTGPADTADTAEAS